MMKIDKVLEDYANHKVPEEKRKPLWHLCIILFAAVVTIPIFMVSQAIISQVGFIEAASSTFIAFLIITFLASFMAYIGAKTNLTVAMISKITFGDHGGKIASFMMGLTLLMWFGVTVDFFGNSLGNILSSNFGIEIPLKVITVISGLLMMSSAIVGFKGLDKVSIFFTPIIIAIFAVMLYKVFRIENSIDVLLGAEQSSMTMSSIISVWIGACAVGILLPPDITRFARSSRQGITSYLFSGLVFSPIVIVVSMILLKIAGQDSFANLIGFLNIGILGAVLLFAATWTTNDNNLYSSALSISVLFSKIAKWKVATVLGLLGIALGVSQVFAYFIPILTILGVCLVPIAGVIIADYFVLNKKRYNLSYTRKKLNVLAITSWLIASLIGVMMSNGLIHSFCSVPAIDALFLAFVMYIFIEKIIRRNK